MRNGQQHTGQARRSSKSPARYQKHTAIADRLRETLLPRAYTLPLLGCWMPSDWESPQEGLVQVVIAREQPDGRVAYASYLVDVYCLGVKDAHHDLNLPANRFQSILELRSQIQPLVEAPVEGAHQLIYQSIEYAARWGFKPHPDFAKASLFLSPRGTYPESYDLTFGREGKPFFVQGPHDNPGAIIAQLERTAGPGNFHFVMALE
jgi:hypothetical protein